MKPLSIISILVFLLVTCSTPKFTSNENENQILLTKKFIGRCDTTISTDRNYTKVYTTKEIIDVRLDGDTIPNNALCYIQLKPVHLAGQLSETYRVFFTWYGTDKLYTIDEEKLADK